MDPTQAADTYRREAIENAPPIKLIRMLYAGALRFLDKALAEDPQDPGSQFVHWLWRADAIVSELRLSLDADRAPDLAENLTQLYLFAESRISEAVRERDPDQVEQARRILETLQDAWQSLNVEAASA